jgi:hypothetical protein
MIRTENYARKEDASVMQHHSVLYPAYPRGTESADTLDEHTRRLIAGAVAEVDPRQIAIYRRLTPAQRIRQLAHLSDWLRQVNLRRLQQGGFSSQ